MLRAFMLVVVLLFVARAVIAQVSPAEILNPELKLAEAKYLPQLMELNREIAGTKFPYSFVLSRYVGLDPARQAEADSRGLEFVRFHDRVVLKVTGNYNAAYNADMLTQNERAGRTFQDVVVPILRLATQKIPPDVACDGIGFEISYHARTPNKNYDYEGKEILVVVFDKADAFRFSQSGDASQQQDILNRSEIYLNGSDFGLVPGAKDPLNVEALARSSSRKAPESSPASASVAARRLAVVSPNLVPSAAKAGRPAPATPGVVASGSAASADGPDAAAPRAAAPAQAEVDSLQTKYQAQLDALAKGGAAKFHFVDYAPPSFAIFQKQIVLQITLRSSLRLDAEKSSIYKRAAQGFDLFLAPLLKDLLDNAPADAEFDAFDFSVVNQLSPGPRPSSEAVEFICPRKAALQFAYAEITNQQLIDQSIVLVNGVRIALNLQLVE